MTPETLKEKRLIRKVSVDVKVLGVGELSKALSVSAHGFSKTAKKKIEKAGGSVIWLRGEPVPKKPKVRKAKPKADEPQDEAPADETPVDDAAEASEDV